MIVIFYCTQAWPKYPLGDQECWPEGESIDYNITLQLDLFYRKERKKSKLCRKCYIDVVSLATLQALTPGEKNLKKWERGNGSYKVTKNPECLRWRSLW
jgi:hypothetical protein